MRCEPTTTMTEKGSELAASSVKPEKDTAGTYRSVWVFSRTFMNETVTGRLLFIKADGGKVREHLKGWRTVECCRRRGRLLLFQALSLYRQCMVAHVGRVILRKTVIVLRAFHNINVLASIQSTREPRDRHGKRTRKQKIKIHPHINDTLYPTLATCYFSVFCVYRVRAESFLRVVFADGSFVHIT